MENLNKKLLTYKKPLHFGNENIVLHRLFDKLTS
jgi:hypothetical protein